MHICVILYIHISGNFSISNNISKNSISNPQKFKFSTSKQLHISLAIIYLDLGHDKFIFIDTYINLLLLFKGYEQAQ